MNGEIKTFLDEPMVLLPLWFIFVATVVIILLSVEIGFRVGLYRRGFEKDEGKKEPIGEIVAAILGLLAFMLGFTFNLAANRFEERRQAVMEEANAIGTTYLRAGLLPESERAETRKLLREYLEVHITAVNSSDLGNGIARCEALQNQLWTQTEALAGKNQGMVPVGLFILSLNNAIDLFDKRVNLGLNTHIPSSIWGSLYFISICSMAMLGFHGGLANTRRMGMVIPLAFTFSVVILMIVGLDRPLAELVSVSQDPMVHLQKNWDAASTGNLPARPTMQHEVPGAPNK